MSRPGGATVDAVDATDTTTDSGRAPVADPAPAPAPWRVERSRPDPAELAALVTVLLALGSAPPPRHREAARSAWADPRGLVRHTPVAGAGAWRASALPRLA